MTFLILLSLICLLSLINFYLFLDLFLLMLFLINLTSMLYLEEYPIYNNLTFFIVSLIRKLVPYLPILDIINFDKDKNIYYIESKSFF